MAEVVVTVNNQRGIHLRPSCLITEEIRGSGRSVSIARSLQGRMTKVTAPADILSLALLPGDIVRVRVDDAGDAALAERVCRKIASLFSKCYDFI